MKTGVFRLALLICFCFAFKANAHLSAPEVPDLTAFTAQPEIVATSRDSYVAVQRYNDGLGEVVFYRSVKSGQTIKVHRNLKGELNFQINFKGQDRFFKLSSDGSVAEKYLHNEQADFHDHVVVPGAKQTLKLPLEQKHIANLKQTQSKVIEDNVVYTSFVVTPQSLSQVLITAQSKEISIEEVFAQLIDYSNLILVNSEVYDFRFALGDIITISDVSDITDLVALSDNPTYPINKAILEGKAERIVYLYQPDMQPGIGGFARLWPFTNDDYNQGALTSESSRHVFLSDIHVDIDDMVLTHELGHSMGLQHERADLLVSHDYAIPYGFSTTIDNQNVGSVMQSGGVSFDKFSNPDLSINDQTIGVAETELDAADASEFLRKTWPLSTRSAPLTDLNFSQNTGGLTISWLSNGDYSQTQLLELNSEFCSDFFVRNLSNSHDIATNQNNLTLSDNPIQKCLVLIGYYEHNGIVLPEIIALRQTPEFVTSIDISSGQQIYYASESEPVNIAFSHSSLPSDSNLSVTIEETKNGSSQFSDIANSGISDAVTVSLNSQTTETTLNIAFTDNPVKLARLLSALSIRDSRARGIRIRVRLCEGDDACFDSSRFLAETYVTVNIESLLASMPQIHLDEVATLFASNTDSQIITGEIHNVSNTDDIEIKVSEQSQERWQLLSSELTYDTTINGYRFSVEVPRPESWLFAHHAIEISVKDTGLVQLAPVYWTAIPRVEMDTGSEISVIDNEYFNMAGTVINVWNEVSDLFISFPAISLEYAGQATTPNSVWIENEDGSISFRQTGLATREGKVLYNLSAYIEQVNRFIPLSSILVNVLADNDNDGMADEWEVLYGLDPSIDDSQLDSDNDGISNLIEYQNRTSPISEDSDNDGIPDSEDAYPNDATRSEQVAEQPSSEVGKLAWKNAIGTTVNNKLAASSEQLYLLTGSRELSAYDRSGNWLWSYRTLSYYPEISVINDVIYLSGDYSSVEAISLQGEKIWEQRFASSWLEKGLTPVRSNGDTLLTSAQIDGSSYLVAMSLEGDKLWQLQTDEIISSIGSVNQLYYVVLDNATVLQVTNDGSVNWQYSPPSQTAFAGNYGTIALDNNGNFYYAAYDNGTYLIALDASGNELWRNSSCCTHAGMVIDANGTLWTGEGGLLTAINTVTGEEIRQVRSAGDITGFVSDEIGAIISGTRSGYVSALLPEATRFGELQWQYNVKAENNWRDVYTDIGRVTSPLVLMDKKLIFLTEEGELVALNTSHNLASETWASIGGDNGNSGSASILIEDSTPATAYDYDGDGLADIAVRRATSHIQYIANSNDDEIQRVSFGTQSSDIPISGDFDGDGITDIAVRRPSTHYWYIKNSSGVDHISGFADGISRVRFGTQSEDIPVPADYDGDGVTDIAIRRPSNQMWYIRNSSGVDSLTGFSDGISRLNFGKQSEDIPVPADYDGDGKVDIAVRRPSNQMWYIYNSSDSAIQRFNFGKQAEDIPVAADYDGDGKADIAVRRPSSQMWYILNSSNGEIQRIHFGKQAEDIPVVADYDGDGKADVAVRRPSNQMWYILNSSDGEIQRANFGKQATDIPLAAPISTRMNMLQGNTELLQNRLADKKASWLSGWQ